MQAERILRQASALTLIGGATALAAGVGAAASPAKSLRRRLWFARLRKPKFQPPARVFGPVWGLLYPTIAWSGYRTWSAPASEDRRRALRWWTTQLGLNALWTPLFFGRQRPALALADSALLLGSAVQYARVARNVDKTAARAMLPYLGWLAFALVLNAGIVARNRRS
jgi:translocator protein